MRKASRTEGDTPYTENLFIQNNKLYIAEVYEYMASCPLCEKKFKDRRGLHGHFRFVHGIEYGSGEAAKRTVLTEAIGRNIKRQMQGDALMKDIEENRAEVFSKPRVLWSNENGIRGSRDEEKRRRKRIVWED